jgi:hypothetical protein
MVMTAQDQIGLTITNYTQQFFVTQANLKAQTAQQEFRGLTRKWWLS